MPVSMSRSAGAPVGANDKVAATFHRGVMVHFGTSPEEYAQKVAQAQEIAKTHARQAKLKKKIAKENSR